MNLYKINSDPETYMFITAVLLGDLAVGEEIRSENGVLKYETKFVSLSSFEEFPKVKLSNRTHANIQAELIQAKTSSLVDRLL